MGVAEKMQQRTMRWSDKVKHAVARTWCRNWVVSGGGRSAEALDSPGFFWRRIRAARGHFCSYFHSLTGGIRSERRRHEALHGDEEGP